MSSMTAAYIVINNGRATVSAAVPHQGAGALIIPGRAASPTRASQVPPYSGSVSASPGVLILLQPPIMVSSYGEKLHSAASRPASAATVYQTDGFGRIVPVGSVVSTVDNNVFSMHAFPAVQGVVSAASGVPVVYHVPSTETTLSLIHI